MPVDRCARSFHELATVHLVRGVLVVRTTEQADPLRFFTCRLHASAWAAGRPRRKKIIFCGEDDAGQTVALQQLLHPPRLDEVAGSSSDELTGYRRSGISALEAQGGGTSRGPLCDRFGWKEIPGVRAQPGAGRGALLRATSVPSARRGWKAALSVGDLQPPVLFAVPVDEPARHRTSRNHRASRAVSRPRVRPHGS